MSLSATPRSPRKAVADAAALLLCQQCWNPLILTEKNGLPKPHPCLFCDQCLQQCRSSEQQTDHGHGQYSDSSRPQFWMYNVGNSSNGKLTRSRKEIILNASLQGNNSHGLGHELESDTDGSKSSLANSYNQGEVYRKTLRRFEKRATRCGFCSAGEKRRKLVEFCFHCHKHLCLECSSWHEKQRFYRHHATVDLTRGPNTALL